MVAASPNWVKPRVGSAFARTLCASWPNCWEIGSVALGWIRSQDLPGGTGMPAPAGGLTYTWSGSTTSVSSSTAGAPEGWTRSVICMDGPTGSKLIAPSPVLLACAGPPLVPPVTVILAVRSTVIWAPVAAPSSVRVAYRASGAGAAGGAGTVGGAGAAGVGPPPHPASSTTSTASARADAPTPVGTPGGTRREVTARCIGGLHTGDEHPPYRVAPALRRCVRGLGQRVLGTPRSTGQDQDGAASATSTLRRASRRPALTPPLATSSSSAHSGSEGGPRCPHPRGQSLIAAARSANALTTSLADTCASPNDRIPGVSITQPSGALSAASGPSGLLNRGSGMATADDEVCRPLPTPESRPTARSASGTSALTSVDLPTPECPMNADSRPVSTARSSSGGRS